MILITYLSLKTEDCIGYSLLFIFWLFWFLLLFSLAFVGVDDYWQLIVHLRHLKLSLSLQPSYLRFFYLFRVTSTLCPVCALGELEIKLIDSTVRAEGTLLLNYKSESIERLNSMELINFISLDRTGCRGFRALQAVLARNFCFWSAVEL